MSYQFDASQLTQANTVKVNRDATSMRLLARRNARQARRAQRAF